MKSLDEWLAKRINALDNHRGHLWQDRYDCRNLLSEGAILVCSIYIDINEIRAGLAAGPADSRHTSAYLRVLAQIQRSERAAAAHGGPPRIELDCQFSDPDIWICPLDIQDRAPLLGVPGTAAADQMWDPAEIAQLEAACIAKRWRHGFLPLTVDKSESQKSLAVRVVMQDTERTLTDQEVEDAVQKLVDAALRQCDARLRV